MVFGKRLKKLHWLLIAFDLKVTFAGREATAIDVGSLVVERERKRVLEKHPCVSPL
jgi:hypothetical protein